MYKYQLIKYGIKIQYFLAKSRHIKISKHFISRGAFTNQSWGPYGWQNHDSITAFTHCTGPSNNLLKPCKVKQ